MMQVPHHGTDPQLRVLPRHGGDGAHLPPGQGLRVQAPPHRQQQEVGLSSGLTDDGLIVIVSSCGRLSARAGLQHSWLVDEDIFVDVVQELETSWMRRCLARRRWHRALNALKAMHTMKKLTVPDTVPGNN